MDPLVASLILHLMCICEYRAVNADDIQRMLFWQLDVEGVQKRGC